MSGIYIHIPFCKQACHYCDFHFSTSVKKKSKLVEMLCKELVLRKDELKPNQIETIYFGGGTPSLLTETEMQLIFHTITENYQLASDVEITLEANPDDLSEEKLEHFKKAGINRLSIGVQSFYEADLKLMNRAHNATEALESLKLAKKYFENISIDLIYGIPGLTNRDWQQNFEQAIALDIRHISSYALTVEPKTALEKFIEKGKVKPVSDNQYREQFDILVNLLTTAGFEHYEFSNFGKPGFHSRNNMGYWLGKAYVGIGPSAHSFIGNQRKWNIANNTLYINAIEDGKLPQQAEDLSLIDRYNEYVMTRLRTYLGVSALDLKTQFGLKLQKYFLESINAFVEKGLVRRENDTFHITPKGKFLSDGIAADLFFVD